MAENEQENAINDQDEKLDLSLRLSPLNSNNARIISSNQELKRKVSVPNALVIHDEEEEGRSERRRKGHNGNFVGKDDGGIRSPVSNGSGSSSAFSDGCHTRSNSGGNSSDTSSHSSHSCVHLPSANAPTASPSVKHHVSQEARLTCSNRNLLQRELSANSRHCSQNLTSTNNIPQPTETKSKEKCNLDKEPCPLPCRLSPKEPKVVIGKPPKPNRQMSQQSVLLPQMPCVSVTGNGPNGKTVTGFLCKYSKTEVSIVCVCHGKSFSPAGFVEHAGGVDVEHPLKHIRVVPFTLA